MLPKDFPKWNTVYSYFVRWKYPGKQGISVLKQALRQEVEAARIQDGRPALTSFLIVDSQSVKNTDTAERKGYDAEKRYRASNAT
jgi:transposase